MGLTSLFLAGEQAGAEDSDDEASPGAAPTLAEVFGRGFDRGYDEYEARLAAYREILAAASSVPTQNSGGAAKGPEEAQAGGDPA